MEYLSTVEMALLGVLFSDGEISGYQINKIIEQRGFREWAGIGSTSIYVGLKKLEQKKYVELIINPSKAGKGPVPNRYKINKHGINTLKQETRHALSSRTRYDVKYDLALATSTILSDEEVISALTQRKEKFQEHLDYIKKEKYEKQGGKSLPTHVKLLFERSFMLMQTEIEFIDKALKEFQKKEQI